MIKKEADKILKCKGLIIEIQRMWNVKAKALPVIRGTIFGAGKSDMRIECFPGIRVDRLRRVVENRDLGHSDAVVIHVGTNDVRRPRNLDFIMGEVYDLVNTAKATFAASRLVLSGVLRSKGVNWRPVGALNGRVEWVARALRATFVGPNSWIRDEDFGRDGLHLN